MNFEEMKVIWDTQNEEPLYAFNQTALQANVRKKAHRFKRLVVLFEVVIMAVALGMGAIYIVEPLLEGAHYHRFISAAILLGAALYFFIGIRSRWQREAGFDPSLLGDLNKALWQIEYHITRSRALRWGFIVPFTIAVSIDFAFLYDTKPAWLWVLFLALMAVSTWAIEKEIRHLYLPKQRKLEALREMLVEPEVAV